MVRQTANSEPLQSDRGPGEELPVPGCRDQQRTIGASAGVGEEHVLTRRHRVGGRKGGWLQLLEDLDRLGRLGEVG